MWLLAIGLPLAGFSPSVSDAKTPNTDRPIDYTRDIQPILGKCIGCHGGVKKSAGLSVISRQLLLSETDYGEPVVVVGDSSASSLLDRITAEDPDERMPPEEPLEPSEIETLRAWIDQGVTWPAHWAYLSLQVAGEKSIDGFVGHRLSAEGIAPAEAADQRTLIRRLSLDLTGLLPTVPEVEAFVADDSPEAYSELVDRLLASPHFGERWARHWLDEARYADSEGYEKDTAKNDAFRYRDWVVQSLNDDMSFDEFTIKQIAGDLLPNPTHEDLIATKFHLQTQFNLEGGVDAEEDRTKRVIDQVSTIGTVWLASTIGCCQCHDHPYDSFTQREFYTMYAFFNNTDYDADFLGDEPVKAEKLRKERQAKALNLTKLLDRQVEDKNLSSTAIVELIAMHNYDNKNGFVRFLRERTKARRSTYVFRRGDFLQPVTEEGELLPNTSATLPPLQSRGEVPDRLDLAHWLVSPENPLVARVAVNKVWMHLFGKPLVRSPGDYGTRGMTASYPELLDELAHWYLHDAEWSRKALIRRIVHSETYKQSSATRPELIEIDPDNELLASQNRFRVEAEILRDIALQTSGLLSRKIGGPCVFPPLPAIVAQQTYSGNHYRVSKGEDRYRRGLYTFFRRTAIDPNLTTFDCPDSSGAKPQRDSSNNALQALALLQNEVFHEAAQSFAGRLLELSLAEASDHARLRQGYLIAVSREPDPAEIAMFESLLREARAYYHDHPQEAAELVGKHAVTNVDPAENAAWIATVRVILNFDEFVTRE
ncbi:MAG: DUF1549 domain-containing protein [Planctomycetes bacterium]|nr:DUF1549 domain-containing protein [Planctomycetota bacterium]